jgi:ATP-binding cassette, subfamily C, bacterial
MSVSSSGSSPAGAAGARPRGGRGPGEWLGLLLLAPLLSLAGLDLGGGTASRIAGIAEQVLAGLRVPPTLPAVLVIYAGVVAGRAALQRWQSIAMADLESRLVRDIRRRLFHAILRTRWIVVSRKRSSDLLHALTSQVSRVGMATDHLLPLAAQVLIVAVYLLFAFMLSPPVTRAGRHRRVWRFCWSCVGRRGGHSPRESG